MDLKNDSKTRLVLICVAVVLVVWGVGYALDRLLVHDGVTRVEIMLLSNGLTGVVAGYLFYTWTLNEQLRTASIRERLHTIAEMNHHIRNALQVITYATATSQGDASVELIRTSVERIEWALREVLPGHITVPVAPANLPPKESEERVRVG